MEYDGQSMADILARRRTTIMWSQSNLQPLQQNIQPGFQQNIFIQPSRQFMNLAKQKLYFRPVIQSGVDNNLPDLARKQMLGISPIDSASFWTCQSILCNGVQIKSQSQSQLQRTSSQFMAYYHSMTANPKKKRLTGCTSVAGQAFSSSNGSTIQGFQRNIPTHPVSFNVASAGFPAQANQSSQASSLVEGLEYTVDTGTGALTATTNYFPRAIISRHKIINPDFCMQVPGTANGVNNIYFSAQISQNGDAQTPCVLPAGSPGPLPLLARSTTPSINIYMAQQERFEQMRRRFYTQVVTPLHCPWSAFGANLVQTNVTPTITPYGYPSGQQGGGNGAPQLAYLDLGEQYCLSVQNGDYVYGANSLTGKVTTTVGTNTQRQVGTITELSQARTTVVPSEEYTYLSVSLGDLSMELDQIGEVCLEDKQWQIQLQANLPQNVLSAFLQPSLFANGTAAGAQISANAGPSTGQCVTFLQACTLGTATYQITDTIMRLEYIDYPEESYQIVKKVRQAPIPYMSLRGPQIDPLPIQQSGTFTQRIAINNPIVIGFVSFLVPTNNNKATFVNQIGSQQPSPLPQDTVLNYMGCNPPTDLRGTYLDSYAMTLQSYYIDDGSGRRYESNDVNISNGQYLTYLRSMDGMQSMFKHYLDIDFAEWVQNRAIICIPFNTGASPDLALTSSQVVLSLTVDFTPRVQSSKLYGECNYNCANQFSLVTYAVTAQSYVDGLVRVA